MISVTNGSHHVQSTLRGEQRWMDTKEGRGKSMKNALHVQWYDKRHLSVLNSEKIKPVALAIV